MKPIHYFYHQQNHKRKTKFVYTLPSVYCTEPIENWDRVSLSTEFLVPKKGLKPITPIYYTSKIKINAVKSLYALFSIYFAGPIVE